MNCSFCNAKIPEGEKTCPACGAATSLDDAIPAPSPYFTETVGEPTPPPAPRKKAAKPPVVEAGPAVLPGPDAPPDYQTIAAEAEPPALAPAWEPPLELKSLTADKSNWAIASLVLGVLGLASCVMPGCCTILSSLPAIILGFMSMKSSRKGFAIAGIVLGFVGFAILVVWIVIMVAGMAYGNSTAS